MSRINSKISSIQSLIFEPISGGKAINVTKLARIENTIVLLGADGVIYSSGVQSRCSYSAQSDSLDKTLDACVKLGILSDAEVNRHKSHMEAKKVARELRWRAEEALQCMDKLGIPLNKTQLAALNKFLPVAAS